MAFFLQSFTYFHRTINSATLIIAQITTKSNKMLFILQIIY